MILKGLENGVIEVSAKILDDYYESIFTIDKLYIIENFSVYPFKEVLIVPCYPLQFEVYKVFVQNKTRNFKPVSLPSKQFNWEIEEGATGSVNQEGQFTANKNFGHSLVQIADTLNGENKITLKVQVVEPHIIELGAQLYDDRIYELIKSGRLVDQEELGQFDHSWNFTLGEKYIIKAQLVNEAGKPIISSKMNFRFQMSKGSLLIQEKIDNFLVVVPLELERQDQITVELPKQFCIENMLVSSKSFAVLSKISILKPRSGIIYLPYLPNQEE